MFVPVTGEPQLRAVLTAHMNLSMGCVARRRSPLSSLTSSTCKTCTTASAARRARRQPVGRLVPYHNFQNVGVSRRDCDCAGRTADRLGAFQPLDIERFKLPVHEAARRRHCKSDGDQRSLPSMRLAPRSDIAMSQPMARANGKAAAASRASCFTSGQSGKRQPTSGRAVPGTAVT